MKILAIDTSSRCGCVGICEDGTPVAHAALLSRETYSARLLPSIEWLLKNAGMTIEEIDGFGVSVGPGSFTGLRVGLATIKGFAWAQKAPVAGIISLELLARNDLDETATIVPMLDARKGRIYGAAYRWMDQNLVELISPLDLEAVDLLNKVSGPVHLLGDGARKYEKELQALNRDHVRFLPESYDIPSGLILAEMAYKALRKETTLDIYSAEPLYIRPSEAEVLLKEKDSK